PAGTKAQQSGRQPTQLSATSEASQNQPNGAGPNGSGAADDSAGHVDAGDGRKAEIDGVEGLADGTPGKAGGTDSAGSNGSVVSVVPGIARYHKADCILIRFLGAEDLETMSVQDAEAAECAPCRACRPDRVEATH